MQVSTSAILVFGKNPKLYFPRVRVRFLRYEGSKECVGAKMNMITKVIEYMDTQIKEKNVSW